ncbi:MAG: biopolymer transporter ExbD [Pseudomonadota bacterium]
MKSSHHVRRMERHNRMRSRAVHLNLVSLIDVFAVLVFFLLLSASLAADRLNALGLDLPSPDQVPSQQEPQKVLSVVIRKDLLQITDRNGAVTPIPNDAKGYDFKRLTETLVAIKQAQPSKDDITLLLEADVAYDVLVQTMDAARSLPKGVQIGENPSRDLFPQISIGDAPKAAGGNS